MAEITRVDESKKDQQIEECKLEPAVVDDRFDFQLVMMNGFPIFKKVFVAPPPLSELYEPFEIAGTHYQHMAVLPNDQFVLAVRNPRSESTVLQVCDYITQKELKQFPLQGFKNPYLYGLPNGQLIVSEVTDASNHTVVLDVMTAQVVAEIEISVTPYKTPIIYKDYLAWIADGNKKIYIYNIDDFSKPYAVLPMAVEVAALFSAPAHIEGLVVVPREGDPQVYRDKNNTFKNVSGIVSQKEHREMIIFARTKIDRKSPIAQCSYCNSKDIQLTYYPPVSEGQPGAIPPLRVLHDDQSVSLAHSASQKTAQVTLGYEHTIPYWALFGRKLDEIRKDEDKSLPREVMYKVTGAIRHVMFLDKDVFAVNSAEGVSIHFSLAALFRMERARFHFGEYNVTKKQVILPEDAKYASTFWRRRAEKCPDEIVIEAKSAEVEAETKPAASHASNPQILFSQPVTIPKESAPSVAEEKSATTRRNCWRRVGSCVVL